MLAGLLGAAPSASADKILYARITYPQGEHWRVMRPDGTHLRRLPAFGEAPDLTLDGRRMVFEASSNAIYTSPFAHPRLRVVWRLPLDTIDPPFNPRWSPSGKRIAAQRAVKPPSNWPEGKFSQVFVIRPGAGRPRRLRTPMSVGTPDWSPDGRRIVAGGFRSQTMCTGTPPFYLDRECTTTFSSGLWVINLATGAAREILNFDNELVGAPAWSPNGRTIAFNRAITAKGLITNDEHLWTVRPDGTGLRQLTPILVCPQRPSWSPNGRRLAVTIQKEGGRSDIGDIATIRADGSGLRVLTHSGNNFNPDWSR